jgi:4-amino-4-deoxy-L-arabinose transferase-like glycosyltransferase
MTSALVQPQRPAVGLRGVVAAAALMAVCALAAGLRFYAFDRVYLTPYYDAAVRSMGLSWHNFFYGALDPSGQVSIDKAPVDLWLQVASTKLLGFSSVSLRLPPAIAGTLSALLLYDLVRCGFGRGAGLAAAFALAVLPASVLTSRSDTMDGVMSMLLLLAAWLVVRASPAHRATAVVAAGFVAGLAFEVKLFEAVVAVPALALLGWLALEGRTARRARVLLLAGLAYLVAAASWPVAASLLPGSHPYPLGSTDGQIWNAILVYNGVERFGTGRPARPRRGFSDCSKRVRRANSAHSSVSSSPSRCCSGRWQCCAAARVPAPVARLPTAAGRMGHQCLAGHRLSRGQLHGPSVAALSRGLHARCRRGHRCRSGRRRARRGPSPSRTARPRLVRGRGRAGRAGGGR